MKIVSIEPTPSPNSMKLNMDEHLPAGKSLNLNQENKLGAPPYLQQLLNISGVKGVFQVADFIAIDRNPKVDWKEILFEARQVFEQGKEEFNDPTIAQSTNPFGEISVFVQSYKGIPMQLKLVSGLEDVRVGLPKQFSEAVLKAQSSSENVVLERKWIEKGIRYGEVKEVGIQLVEELTASYDEGRLDRLVAQACAGKTEEKIEKEFSGGTVESRLEDSDWRVRYAALERMQLIEHNVPFLEKALHDEKMSIRRLATAYLPEIGGSVAINLLCQALMDKSPIVRRTAGDALSDIGDPQAMESMMQALKDDSKLVRWRAARFLYELGDERAIPALREAQNDSEFEVSLQVKMALERIEAGEEAKGTVWQQMTNRDKD